MSKYVKLKNIEISTGNIVNRKNNVKYGASMR